MSSDIPIPTADNRYDTGVSYTDPSLQVNLFFRVFLGIVAILATWVPMRLLWRNGELAASVFCGNVIVLNLFYVINALIWQDNNITVWYAGWGWCDLQSYLIFPLETLYAACVFAIMRNLARQVGLMRVSTLTAGEKRRRNIIQALIMFPAPVLQVILTYFILSQRFLVATLIGCARLYDLSWPYLVFFIIPAPLFCVGAAVFAVITWIRFREIDETTRAAINPSNAGIAARHQRVRRKLFLMSLCILVPFLPIQIAFFVVDVTSGLPWFRAYDFNAIHSSDTWNTILFLTSDNLGFPDLNQNYIPIITAIPIFWFFGATKEAINVYRRFLLRLGLGSIFPTLHDEYDPDRTRTSQGSSWGNASSFLWSKMKGSSTQSKTRTEKSSGPSATAHLSLASTSTTAGDPNDVSIDSAPRGGTDAAASSPTYPEPKLNPWPEPDGSEHRPGSQDGLLVVPPRSGWLMRTTLAGPIRLPLPVPALGFWRRRKKDDGAPAMDLEAGGLEASASAAAASPHPLGHGVVALTARASAFRSPPADLGDVLEAGWAGDALGSPTVQTRVFSVPPPAGDDAGLMVGELGNKGAVVVRRDIESSTESLGK